MDKLINEFLFYNFVLLFSVYAMLRARAFVRALIPFVLAFYTLTQKLIDHAHVLPGDLANTTETAVDANTTIKVYEYSQVALPKGYTDFLYVLILAGVSYLFFVKTFQREWRST